MRKLLICTFSLLVLTSLSSCDSDTTVNAPAGGASTSELALRSAMDKLWEDHVTWTRNVILAVIDDLPGATEATTRLLANQDDIGDAIKPYYGDAAGEELSKLLHSHIMTAADVLVAAKAGNATALSDANARWTANADSIATFLGTANPTNWPVEEMKMMMHEHLQHTTDEAVARIQKNYAADVAAYDQVHTQILKMADMLSDGIVAQFPDKF